jgi:predicted ATPase
MRVTRLELIDFKRFHRLNLDLSNHPAKIIALVGPNGSGKSSVLDAFEEYASSTHKGRGGKPLTYYQKSIFDPGLAALGTYNVGDNVKVETDQATLSKTSFYLRSAYRFTPRLEVENIKRLSDIQDDSNRPKLMIEQDDRLRENYERMLGNFFGEVFDQDITGKNWAKQNVGKLNDILSRILDIRITYLGNPVEGQGTLYFEKGISKRFPYENLSAGEKEVVDLVLDLFVKKSVYSNSVICIDEPELHLNTAIQRSLLRELDKLVSDDSQLWVATHSIGFLRALQEDLREKSAVLDFTNQDFDRAVTVKPIVGSRVDWMRIFETALEDLTGLLAPERIVYCEGRPDPSTTGAEQGLDAEVYGNVFVASHANTMFVSSGGTDVKNNAAIGLKILHKALSQVDLYVLKDLDSNTPAQRVAYLGQDPSHRMLTRREIENFLFDKEVLKQFCADNGKKFDEPRYNKAVTNIVTQKMKLVQSEVKAACHQGGTMDAFKRALGRTIRPSMAVYKELENSIF